MILKKCLTATGLIASLNVAAACPQVKAVQVNQALMQKLTGLKHDSSNAHEIEQLIGPACACLPTSSEPSENWVCQWKGNLSSNRLENTLNITFEAGMVARIVGIDAKGDFISNKK